MALAYADRFTFDGGDVWLSEFRLLATHPDWDAARRTTDDAFLVAFPRTTVAIRHEQRSEVVADPMSAVVYSPGQVYRRRLISASGDDCTILAVRPEIVARAAAAFDMNADPLTYRAPFAAVDVDRAAHAAMERVRRCVTDGASFDREAIREELYWLVQHVVSSGYRPTRRASRAATADAHRELADEVRATLGRDLTVSWLLDDLAAHVAVSPFHLVRVFRQVTGRPIHSYATELRLRSSLPLIADGMRLADVAQQVGFASHAHLTDRFARSYGTTPALWRQTSKNMEASGEGAFIA